MNSKDIFKAKDFDYDINTKKCICPDNKNMKKRKCIEALFGNAKDYMGLRECKFRLAWNVSEQFYMTAAVQNIRKYIKLITKNKENVFYQKFLNIYK